MYIPIEQLMVGDCVRVEIVPSVTCFCRIKREMFRGALKFVAIPLTSTHLEKAGFEAKEKRGENSVYEYNKDGFVIVVLLLKSTFVANIENNEVFDGTTAVYGGHYIHEFQQALRVCGLHELANSF